MNSLLDEIKVDLAFVRSHTLQPTWYKALKVVILVGFLSGYGYLEEAPHARSTPEADKA